MQSCCISLVPAAAPPKIAPGSQRRPGAPGILIVNHARKNYHRGRMSAYFRRKQRNGVAKHVFHGNRARNPLASGNLEG